MRNVERSSHREFLPLILPVLLICLTVTCAHAFQQGQPGERGMVSARAVVNFLDLARKEAENPPKPERRVVPFMRVPVEYPVPPGVPIPRPAAPPPTPVPQPLVPSPAPTASFEALGDNNTTIPPDTQGTVGLNHLMVALNSQVRIQNKSGGVISTVSLNSFWSSLSIGFAFDPKLAYDPFQNRYIFAAVSDAEAAASSVLIGVSQTNDPTGSWNLYKVDADSGNTDWADYPSLGFNKDWIVVSVNLFDIPPPGGFGGSKIYTFKKSDLYSGAMSPTITIFTDSSGTFAPAATYDNSLATMHLVQNWNGNFMGSGFLRLSTITGAVGSEVLTTATFFPSTANTWASSPPGGADFAPQKDTAVEIQNNDSRMLSVVYRNGSLWCAHSAFLPAMAPTRTAAQWWQITPGTGAVVQFGRVDDGTGANFYAFPTIAVNAQNDVLLGYSCFSATTFASACYSFRSGTDAANTLRDNTVMRAGDGIYWKTFGGGRNRWGDYSNTAVDPVDDQTMWTIQEYAAARVSTGDGSGRWGTWWVKIAGTKKRRGQVTSQ